MAVLDQNEMLLDACDEIKERMAREAADQATIREMADTIRTLHAMLDSYGNRDAAGRPPAKGPVRRKVGGSRRRTNVAGSKERDAKDQRREDDFWTCTNEWEAGGKNVARDGQANVGMAYRPAKPDNLLWSSCEAAAPMKIKNLY